ncbi:unnamed protein product [Tuber melanosporum]|uniref:(Perigord truffle) hypothetical protein n=1 Tax=Tuber melanosporum (strain Mel28) TaxID=656061 RepID=D5GLA0_TUBMM|nr:uncharacterized protein GSTUM_00010085001 [Tuber melanosporum]CAZ85293.1 unnamed protein product [Tuber melanosporum]
MAWTTLQLEILQTTSRVSSVFSLLGASFIIITFCASTSFHKPINRLAFFASFGNILTNVATITSRKGIEHGSQSALCKLQATFIQWFMPADALFCLAMALNVYLTVFKKYTTKRLRDLELTYILVCYGVPSIPAVIFLFIQNSNGVYIYGSATLWCWISNEWQFMRIAAFYGPVWIILGVTIIIYILAGRVIFRLRGSLRNFAGKSALGPPVKDTWSTQSHNISRTMSPDLTPGPSASINPPPSYTVIIESGPKPPVANNNNNNRAPRNSAVEANTAAWAYCRCAMLFFLALLITWLPSSVNRIYNLIYPDATHFGLNFAAALVLPCQGFWNGLIYIVTTLPACKEFCRNLGERLRRPFDMAARWKRSRRSWSSKASSTNSLQPV